MPFLLDASGPLLVNGMEASPVLIKPNEEEYYATFGVHPSVTQEFCASYRQLLMAHNIAYGAVSLGKRVRCWSHRKPHGIRNLFLWM